MGRIAEPVELAHEFASNTRVRKGMKHTKHSKNGAVTRPVLSQREMRRVSLHRRRAKTTVQAHNANDELKKHKDECAMLSHLRKCHVDTFRVRFYRSGKCAAYVCAAVEQNFQTIQVYRAEDSRSPHSPIFALLSFRNFWST